MADKKDKDKKKGLFGFGSKKKKKVNRVFENILTDTALFAEFEEYLSKQFSQENLQFYRDVATYTGLGDKKAMKDEAQKICEKYLGIGTAPAVLNISPLTVKQITSDLKKNSVSTSIFEIAKHDIEQLLKTNFVNYASA